MASTDIISWCIFLIFGVTLVPVSHILWQVRSNCSWALKYTWHPSIRSPYPSPIRGRKVEAWRQVNSECQIEQIDVVLCTQGSSHILIVDHGCHWHQRLGLLSINHHDEWSRNDAECDWYGFVRFCSPRSSMIKGKYDRFIIYRRQHLPTADDSRWRFNWACLVAYIYIRRSASWRHFKYLVLLLNKSN